MAKKMVVNAAACDVRKVSEETLAAYESIVINAATVLTNEASRALLGKYPVVMNCANAVDVEGDVQVRTVNGSDRIAATDRIPACKQYLIANGSVTVDPGTEKILENYVGMTVNGSITYPESLSGFLSMATVNGSALCYPDGAVILKSSAVIDRLFALRAKNSLYWSRKRMVMVDPALDGEALAQKGTRFQTKQVILAESKVESLIGLIDEQADIVIVPDGTSVVADDLTLDDIAVKKYGKKMYVIGDVKAKEAGRGALESLEYLNIRGDVLVDSSLRELLLTKAQEIGGEVKSMGGRYITDHIRVKISRWLLEQERRACRCRTVCP